MGRLWETREVSNTGHRSTDRRRACAVQSIHFSRQMPASSCERHPCSEFENSNLKIEPNLKPRKERGWEHFMNLESCFYGQCNFKWCAVFLRAFFSNHFLFKYFFHTEYLKNMTSKINSTLYVSGDVGHLPVAILQRRRSVVVTRSIFTGALLPGYAMFICRMFLCWAFWNLKLIFLSAHFEIEHMNTEQLFFYFEIEWC